jgi:hypothetical protein
MPPHTPSNTRAADGADLMARGRERSRRREQRIEPVRCRQRHVVQQARAAGARRADHERGPARRGERHERERVDDLEILPNERRFEQPRAARLRLRGGLQRAREARCGGALLGRQINVPAREREPVRFAHRRMDDDAYRQIEIVHQRAQHRALLGVLLPEIERRRFERVEQLQHDRRHAVEVTRPRRALERASQFARIERRCEAGRIHRLDRRRVQHRGTARLELCEVVRERARVAAEIFVRPELQRIHEERTGHARIFGGGAFDQTAVPGMQRAHRRHEAERSRQAARERSSRVRRLDDVHASVAARHSQHGPPHEETIAERDLGLARDRSFAHGRPVAAGQVGQNQMLAGFAELGVPARNVPVERDAGGGYRLVPSDRNLAVEGPGLAVQGTADHFKDIHFLREFGSGASNSLDVRIFAGAATDD